MDPTLGRFISPDSIVPDLTAASSFNRFAYVSNNPLKYVDPSGHGTCYYPELGGGSVPCPDEDEKLFGQGVPPPPPPPSVPVVPIRNPGPVRPAPPAPTFRPIPAPTEYLVIFDNPVLSDGQRALPTHLDSIAARVVLVPAWHWKDVAGTILKKKAYVEDGVIFIKAGNFQDTALLYHEATHVIQQREIGWKLFAALYVVNPIWSDFKDYVEAQADVVQLRVADNLANMNSPITIIPLR